MRNALALVLCLAAGCIVDAELETAAPELGVGGYGREVPVAFVVEPLPAEGEPPSTELDPDVIEGRRPWRPPGASFELRVAPELTGPTRAGPVGGVVAVPVLVWGGTVIGGKALAWFGGVAIALWYGGTHPDDVRTIAAAVESSFRPPIISMQEDEVESDAARAYVLSRVEAVARPFESATARCGRVGFHENYQQASSFTPVYTTFQVAWILTCGNGLTVVANPSHISFPWTEELFHPPRVVFLVNVGDEPLTAVFSDPAMGAKELPPYFPVPFLLPFNAGARSTRHGTITAPGVYTPANVELYIRP